jgi:hypothetical protein
MQGISTSCVFALIEMLPLLPTMEMCEALCDAFASFPSVYRCRVVRESGNEVANGVTVVQNTENLPRASI